VSKIILITGASTGIGAEAARQLAAGNEIILHYNSSADAAREVAQAVEAEGGTPHLAQADLGREAGCWRLIDFVTDRFDRLDVLINNAGALIERRHVPELQWELMEKTFALNVFSLMLLSSRCLPLLEKGDQPCIINITSIAMRHGAPSATIYGAAKGAVDSFTRGMAREAAPTVRVNAVAPGVIVTPFHEKVSSPERMKSWRESNLLKRHGTTDDIVSVIKMLIDNPFITGETVDVNGGDFMR
jgi:3-oxoacyl-[acyl-carrier protein] reductase